MISMISDLFHFIFFYHGKELPKRSSSTASSNAENYRDYYWLKQYYWLKRKILKLHHWSNFNNTKPRKDSEMKKSNIFLSSYFVILYLINRWANTSLIRRKSTHRVRWISICILWVLKPQNCKSFIVFLLDLFLCLHCCRFPHVRPAYWLPSSFSCVNHSQVTHMHLH